MCLAAIICCIIVAVVSGFKEEWTNVVCAIAAVFFAGGFWVQVEADKGLDSDYKSILEDHYSITREIEKLGRRINTMTQKADELEHRLETLSGAVLDNELKVDKSKKNEKN